MELYGTEEEHVSGFECFGPDNNDEEDSAVVVTDDDAQKKKSKDEDDDEQDEEMEDDTSDEEDDDSDKNEGDEAMEEEAEEDDEEEEKEEVDQNFRLELMKVLQQQNALVGVQATEEDGSSDEDMDDDAMMELDKSLAALNQLCRSKVYCRTVGDRQGELHDLLDKLMTKTQKLSDSSVCLYYFSASLYVVKVLRGAAAETKEEQTAEKAAANDLSFMGNVDVDRVSGIFRDALTSFMSRRKSPLTAQMFTDLFNRFPVSTETRVAHSGDGRQFRTEDTSPLALTNAADVVVLQVLCVNLLDTAVQHITSGVREHQQGQACVLVLRAMQSREVQQVMRGAPWTKLCVKVTGQLTASLQQVGQTESKMVKEKVLKVLELCQFLVKHVHQQKLSVDLESLHTVLLSLTSVLTFNKTGKLEDTYWAVMKHFGVTKPKVEKTKPDKEDDQQTVSKKKKKGFLPDTKKRKMRKKPVLEPAAADSSTPTDKPAADKGQAKKKHDKKTKQKRAADSAAASQPSPAKKSKTQTENTAAKKKKKKKKPKQKKQQGGEICTKLTVQRNRLVQRLFVLRRRCGDVPAVRALARELLLTSHRSDDDARPHGLPARPGARGAATVALVFLLRALDLPVPKLPLVEVERCQGNEDDPHEHGHQHEEREGGGERRKEAELLRAGAVVGLENPVTAVRRHRQSRGLRGSGCHPVHLPRSTFVTLTPVPFVLSGLSAVTPARACGYLHPKEDT
ncbi:hypothetical protein INR49_027764 [Caranx melampygus]|nr:hypothetical protein INR49_027764 [Caranx melampygus]